MCDKYSVVSFCMKTNTNCINCYDSFIFINLLLSENKSKTSNITKLTTTYFSLLQLTDLINFLAVAFFVVVGVGIYYHANLWPDDQLMWNGDWTDWRIWTIVYYPYWQLYAEMNLGILKGIITILVEN